MVMGFFIFQTIYKETIFKLEFLLTEEQIQFVASKVNEFGE